MPGDAVHGVDHQGRERPSVWTVRQLVGDTHGGSGSVSSSAAMAVSAIAVRSAPVHDAPGDVT